MPDTGLPMNLKIMLDTGVTYCTVKNCGIYEEHCGMTFKIRFNSIDNGGQSLNGMCVVHLLENHLSKKEIRKEQLLLELMRI